MSNTELIKDARGQLAELKEFGGDFDEWEQLAYLTEPLADALEAAESERDAALAIIAEALRQTRRGNVLTPPWVIAALDGEVQP